MRTRVLGSGVRHSRPLGLEFLVDLENESIHSKSCRWPNIWGGKVASCSPAKRTTSNTDNTCFCFLNLA